DVREVLLVLDGFAVNRDDQIASQCDRDIPQISPFGAAAKSGALRRAAGNYLNDQQTRVRRQPHLVRQIRSDGNGAHTDFRPAHAAQVNQVVEHRLGRVDGNGKPDAGALLHAAGENHRVDADDLAARVQKRSTRVAGIDGGI